VGLDEAAAGGLTVTEVDESGSVESLLVANPLGTAALLYEGEELVGAKQNRVLERSILVAAGSTLEIPAKCVEQAPGQGEGTARRQSKAAVLSGELASGCIWRIGKRSW